jgi:hypothetical protein
MSAADVALHQRVAHADPEHLRGVDAAVEARDEVQALPREERERGHFEPDIGRGERAVAVAQPVEVGHAVGEHGGVFLCQ